MREARWQTINEIFDAALDLPEDERLAYVRKEAGSDEELFSRVEALLRADAKASAFLAEPVARLSTLSPWLAQPAPQAGDLIAQRFEIVRFLDAGGMGRVYEAFDTELHIPVALKLISPEFSEHPEMLERFRREVTLARKISHPHVCRTFDFGRTQIEGTEVVFLTMEFLHGVTLRERLKAGGALAAEEALTIARQVADALEAAHALGVIHRDIKPGNIMLTGSGAGQRAIVMDFGLARSLEPGVRSPEVSSPRLSVTQAGVPLGTLAYMAPEQIEGLAASPATDTYALALVVIEMLSGQRVFRSENPLSGLAQRLRGSVPIGELLPEGVPATWVGALEKGLAPDPAQRHARPKALVEALDASAPGRSSALSWVRGKVARRGKMLAVAGVLAGLVSLLPLGLRLFHRETTSAVAQGATIYVAPLANRSSLRDLDGLGTMLSTTLQQSVQVRLLEPAKVEQVLRSMNRSTDSPMDARTAREIAMRAGAVRVVFPSIERSGSKLTLMLRVEQPDQTPARARASWDKAFEWTQTGSGATIAPQALAAVRDAGDWVRARAGESAADIARLDLPPEDATTSNWQALEEYANAEKLLREGKTEPAVNSLVRSLRFDPQFALAQARLGDVLSSAGQWQASMNAYSAAMLSASGQRLTRREADRVRGIYALDTLDYETADEQFRDLTAFYPEDWLGWFYRADALLRLGRQDEAMRSLARAAALHGESKNLLMTSGMFSLFGGDLDTARRWQAKLAKVSPADAAQLHVLIAYADGRFDSIPEDLQAMAADGTDAHLFWRALLYASLLADAGQESEAMAVLGEQETHSAAAGAESERAILLMQLGSLACKVKDWGECFAKIERSLGLDQSPQQALLASSALSEVSPDSPKVVRARAVRLLETLETSAAGSGVGPVFQMARLQARAQREILESKCSTALADLRAEAALDAPTSPQIYLARGMLACEARPGDGVRFDKALILEAVWRAVADSRATLYDARRFVPGIAGEMQREWITRAPPKDSRSSGIANRLADLHRVVSSTATQGLMRSDRP